MLRTRRDSFDKLDISLYRLCRDARGKKPVVHFVVTCLSLLTLAWLGNKINNFFLAYLLTLGLMMVPGLQRRGLLQVGTIHLTE